jgi:hypothetical protein
MANLKVKDGSGAEKYLAYTGTGTDADPHQSTSGLVDAGNSTTSALGGGAVFTGTAYDVSNYSEITISYATDVEGATDGLQMQFSPDGTNWDRAIKITPPQIGLTNNYGGAHALAVINQYFRIVYTNGSGAQGHFRLQTIYHKEKSIGLVSRSQQVLSKMNDVQLTRLSNEAEYDQNAGLIGWLSMQRKFGVNETVGTSYEPIWGNSGAYTFPTTAEGFRVQAGGNINDTSGGTGARTIEITYLDNTWTETIETLTLAGASASASTSKTGYRVNRVRVMTSGTYHGANTGIITIENDVTNQVVAEIPADTGITEQMVYTVPLGKTMYIKHIDISVGASDSCDVHLVSFPNSDDFSAPYDRVKRIEWQIEDFSGIYEDVKTTYLKYEEKTDLIMEAKRVTGSGSARVSAKMDFVLTDN